jgi:hypothetical protein
MFYHLAIAASLLAAFTLGFAWQKGPVAAPRGATNAGSQIAGVAATGDSIASEVPPQRHQTGDALTLWVRDSAGGAQPVHVPLVDAGAVDQRFGVEFRSGWPDAIRERLRQSGYDVQSKRRYAPLWFENGRSLVVPVEDTRIVPVSRPVH